MLVLLPRSTPIAEESLAVHMSFSRARLSAFLRNAIVWQPFYEQECLTIDLRRLCEIRHLLCVSNYASLRMSRQQDLMSSRSFPHVFAFAIK